MDQLIKKIDVLLKCEDILEGYDNNTSELSHKLNVEITLMKKKIGDLGSILSEQKSQISECKELIDTLNSMNVFIAHINDNLPARYNYKSSNTEHVNADNARTTMSQKLTMQMVPKPMLPEDELHTGISPIRGNDMHWNDLSPYSVELMKECQTGCRSSITYFTLEEFDNIPRYLKGRLSYETVNTFIDNFNATLKKKYEIFGQPRETLRGKTLSVYDGFKKQETIETIEKGIYFCTADDLKTYGNIMTDKKSQNILIILRNAQRIREIRTPGLVRYAVSA